MKKLNIIMLLLIFLASACKKDAIDFKASASFNVINAVVGLGAVKVNAESGPRFFYSKANDVGFGTGNFYQTFVGSRAITVVISSDTTKTVFSAKIDLKQTVNSLYLIGTSAAVDTMFRVESIPLIPYAGDPDNSGYIRFVNLSPGSAPLNVKIKAGSTNEVNALQYKGISDFKKYVALSTTVDYVFEVWDVTNTNKLGSYTLKAVNLKFKTLSLIITGNVGTSLALSPVVYY